jgi:hypothetical protein
MDFKVHKYQDNQRNRQETKKNKYFIKQKMMGFLLLVSAFISIVVLEDISLSVLIIPMALYTMFTKEKVLALKDYNSNQTKHFRVKTQLK